MASSTPTTQEQFTSGTGTKPEKAKRAVSVTRQPKNLKSGIRPSTEPFQERIHIQHLLQLDDNIIREVRSIQQDPEKFLRQVEKHITAFRKVLLKNSEHPTNDLGMGYYYFLKALAMLEAKMSDDDKTIELSFSPVVKLNAKKIKETILSSRNYYFPYAAMLLLFFEHSMEEKSNIIINANLSAFSGVSQSIEVLLESDSNQTVLAGIFLKWLMLIPKPFELKLAFDKDTYLKNPKSNIPGRVTPSIHLLREFLEQLPVKGSDGAVDVVLNQMDQKFTNTQHLPNEQHGQTAVTANARAAPLGKTAVTEAALKAAKEARALASTSLEIATVSTTAVALVTAAAETEQAELTAASMEAVEEALDIAATKSKATKTAIAAANRAIETILEEEEQEQAQAAKNAKANLKLILYFATGRSELIDSDCTDLSVYIINLSILGFESSSEISIFLKETQKELYEDINPENRAIADVIELAFHLVDTESEVQPVLPHLKALPFSIQARLTALHFGHDLQLLTKLIGLLPEQVSKDTTTYWHNTLLMAHRYIITLIGGNAEMAKKLQSDSAGWKKLDKWFQLFVWHKPVKFNTIARNLDSQLLDYAVFHSDNLKKFEVGEEINFFLAIEQAKRAGYQKLKQRLNQYDKQMDSQSLQMSGWLHCLAGLTLLEARIRPDFQQVVLTGHKRVLASAHDHFRKARQLGFPYGGYLESLVLMRLANHYQYNQDETPDVSQTESTYMPMPVIEYTSPKKPKEKIFIEAGKIVTEILPGLIASSVLGARFAAEAAIRVFTDERFNLLYIPQAGWPALIAKHFLITPVNYNIQFLFSNDGPEVEEALFPRISDPDSIERILLKPLEKTRHFSIKKRPKQYGICLDNEIKSSDRPENIKKYLSLVKAFVLDTSEVLDTSSGATASDIEQLSGNTASYELSRMDYTKSLEVLQATPQPETGFDEFVYNLPRLESHQNYEAISNALLKKHRT
ncbi:MULTISPECIES: hypothetical protein, partial [unclassified Endozoicomonas]|uniref:hypothetical protein n=2 Tax=Endozoicomonas TaxID=305899 RepID=UPI0021491778